MTPNPWFNRPPRQQEKQIVIAPDIFLASIEELAAIFWDEWTPARSTADDFQARLAAYILPYYRPQDR